MLQSVSDLKLESKNGWQFLLARPRRTESTTLAFKLKTAQRYALDREPEGT